MVLPRFVHPLDYYPLLIFHVGTGDATWSNLERIRGGYRALGMRVKGKGSRWCLLNPASERGKGLSRNVLIQGVTAWLQSCVRPGFGFCDHSHSEGC